MITLEQEELQLKKRMIDHLEKSEKKYTESMQSFATSLNSLSSTLQTEWLQHARDDDATESESTVQHTSPISAEISPATQ